MVVAEKLKELSIAELEQLAQDIRQEILSACLKNGGHLGASLGTVELAIALHRTFRSPSEPIVWDVGHQAYAHKLLTGRWERFSSLRLTGGISGFLSRDESEHDVFGAGHSSTALSAALAMAWARASTPDRWTVAVVGDGSLTAGLAFEALNNFRSQEVGPLLVVLNDNQMSIAPNVGSIATILCEGRGSEFFSQFGMDYIGPVDGHDLGAVLACLEGIRNEYAGRPVVLHALTQKGRGYSPAEERPVHYHGIGPLSTNPEPGGRPITWSEAFGKALCMRAERDSKVLAITAAMSEGTGLLEFARRFPDRFFDVGIAEQHAVTFAAGLATQGFRPVVAIYSTFLQRGLDSIVHDVATQGLPVIFAVDRAGLVGADGPTHHGVFDLAYFTMVPGITVFAPVTAADVDWAFDRAFAIQGPTAIRYPRGVATQKHSLSPDADGLRWCSREENGLGVAVGVGTAAIRLEEAVKRAAEQGRRWTFVSTVGVKPIPAALVEYLRERPSVRLVVAEDGVRRGGFGEALASLTGHRLESFAIGDHFVPHGALADLEASEGISVAAMAERL